MLNQKYLFHLALFATASEIVNASHVPVFVDVDLHNGNILTDGLEQFISDKTAFQLYT